MVRGFQQRDARGHVKALSYLKHYTMYSDQNQAQPGNVSMHDLHESYLRQYRIAFQQGGASGASAPPPASLTPAPRPFFARLPLPRRCHAARSVLLRRDQRRPRVRQLVHPERGDPRAVGHAGRAHRHRLGRDAPRPARLVGGAGAQRRRRPGDGLAALHVQPGAGDRAGPHDRGEGGRGVAARVHAALCRGPLRPARERGVGVARARGGQQLGAPARHARGGAAGLRAAAE